MICGYMLLRHQSCCGQGFILRDNHYDDGGGGDDVIPRNAWMLMEWPLP